MTALARHGNRLGLRLRALHRGGWHCRGFVEQCADTHAPRRRGGKTTHIGRGEPLDGMFRFGLPRDHTVRAGCAAQEPALRIGPRMSEQRPTVVDADFLAQVRRDLLRFASLQLRDDQLAEDVVQEAMMAALAGEKQFAGRSAVKTWIFSILRNKIVDAIRQKSRSVNFSALLPEEADAEQDFESLFKANGHWLPEETPANWGDPEATLHQEQFWAVFHACLEHLPENTARVFMMREFLEFDTPEVCQELKISASNCHVILHRARNGLRRCLEGKWFAAGTPS